MNTTQKKDQGSAKDLLAGLKMPGYLDDDLRAQVKETAQSGVRYIIDTLEHEYRKTRKLDVSPNGLRQPLRFKAYRMYAGYCEEVAANLRKAANDEKDTF